MKRFIIGNGKVTNVIKNPGDVILSHKDIEITDLASVARALFEAGIHKTFDPVVINTAAKINLEWCEENKHEAYRVNTLGAINVAEACVKYGAKLVHISSGCIFDGNHVLFSETDDPLPAAWYARTKAWADAAIVEMLDNHLILRPRQLISSTPNPTNMLTKFLGIKELACIDEPNSITCIEDFKNMLDHLIESKCTGIFNCANSGTLSPYHIAMELKRRIDPEMKVSKVDYLKYVDTLKVKRVNTILDLRKLRATGYIPPDAFTALDRCLTNYGKVV